jgi:DNA polymerase-3 subunit gamma/tau
MGRRDLDLAPSHKIGFEMCLLRMIAFKPELEIHRNTQATKKEHNIEPDGISKETAKKVNKEEGAGKKESSNKNLDNAIWSDLVTELELKGTSRMLADNCALIKRENNKFFLMLDEKSQSYNNKERQLALSEALSAYYDKRIDIDISVGESKNETPNQEKIRKEDEILKKAKEDLEVDPGIRDIKDIFSGASFDSDSVKLKK